jgi:hypothetical protein
VDKDELENPRDPFHRRVRAELRAIPVPADLRERILAGYQNPNIVRWNFRRPALGLAAGVLLLAAALFYWIRPPGEDKTFTGFQNRMTAFVVRQYSMDFLTRDIGEVRQRLAASGAPAEFQLTTGLRDAPVKGGAKLTWHGRAVSMICFDGPGAKTLFLFVIDAAAVPLAPDRPTVETTKGLASASWTDDGKTYLLAADLPEATLKAFL